MEKTELKIIIPEGYVVNKEKSTDVTVILKPIIKGLTYNDVAKELFAKNDMFYITGYGEICITDIDKEHCCDGNNATSEKQIRCIIAKNKLANVARYLNGNWKPNLDNKGVYIVLYTYTNKLDICCCETDGYTSSRIIFRTAKLAQQAIEILGEEEVKLALRPLY